MIDRYFKEMFLFFYVGAIKNRPKETDVEHKIAAAVMTAPIGVSIGMNVGYVLYKYNYLSHINTKLSVFVFAFYVFFTIVFFNKGTRYLGVTKRYKDKKKCIKYITYYYLICFFTAGFSMLFF